MKLTQKLILCLAFLTGVDMALRASTYKHITIDGSFTDWAGVPVAYQNPSYHDNPGYTDNPTAFAGVTDFQTLYVAHDENYLYVHFTLYSPADPFTSHNNVFVDTDNDATTGFAAVGGLLGSEMLIQTGTGYQEKGGAFNDGFGINNLGWASAPSGPGMEFEFRISRQATFSSDSTPVFGSDTIAFILEAENAQYATEDKLPVDQATVYTFTTPPPPNLSDTPLITLGGTSWKVNASGNDLGTSWSGVIYDDTQSGWISGPGLFGFTPNPGAYPSAIQTALPTTHTTYYLRTHFDWENNTTNVILVATNYLSDGAVFYINGTEVKRVRLPDGTISATTGATGGPAVKGAPELIGLAPESLVIGDNVLAVELHQTTGDTSDLVFGLALGATIDFPATITDPTQPADRGVAAGQSVTFSASYIGNPPFTFQWLKNDQTIQDATNVTYTINPVLQGDVGGYSLRISNPFGPSALTRSALLSVTNTPVTIANTNLPADVSVTEGLPVSFSAVAAGSAPLTYQWFKGSDPIATATNSVLNIPAAQLTDAGDYHAVVANTYPSSATSRTAHLTVVKDVVAPTIVSTTGTATRVSLNFSEAIKAASITNLGHFSASGGLTVNAAALDPADATVVILTTSPQSLGVNYTLTINGVTDLFDNAIAANTQVHFQSTIIIDGSFDDWASVPLAFTDASDSTDSLDYKDVYVASDDKYIYIRVSFYTPGDITDYHDNLFVDANGDATTGYAFGGLGSEMLIQSGAGYQEKNGGFNEGGINGLDYAIAPSGPASEVEFRISRSATYANDGTPVFASPSFAFALESENAGFATKDIAPDSGGFAYTFPVPTGGIVLAIGWNQGQLIISWTGPGRLQSTDSLATGTWMDVSDSANPYTVPVTGTQLYYRLAN